MIQTVLKRDGRIVGFNEEKIVTAIRKAMLHTDKGEDMQLIRQITDHISFKGDAQMTVEAIQDLVEMELMKSSRKDVAQKYIAYRNQRSIARKAKTRDMFLEIINIKSNDITRENANMNADTPAGMMMKFASETTKPFVDDYLLSEEVLDAVSQNYLHIHDKDYYPTKSLTCVQHPLDRILTYGFSAGHGESRPAKRIETASILGGGGDERDADRNDVHDVHGNRFLGRAVLVGHRQPQGAVSRLGAHEDVVLFGGDRYGRVVQIPFVTGVFAVLHLRCERVFPSREHV